MTKKNLLSILGTIAVMILVCCYLYTTNAAYDGGLLDGMMSFFITLPLVGGISLWQIANGKIEPPTKPKWWQMLLTILLLLVIFGIVGHQLVVSRFYSLPSIIFCVLLLAVFPIIYLERKNGYRPAKNPVLQWACIFTTMYLLIFTSVFTYIQVVQPVTVEEATAFVAEAYGENSYEFVGHLDFHKNYNPLGVYWYAQRSAQLDGWVEVDLLTGALNEIE